MRLIVHRRNALADLDATPREYGVEIDIRSTGGRLSLHHDPFETAENFESWLDAYRHGTLIVNVKEEGLEKPVAALLRAKSVEDWFFLDQSFPALIQCARAGERRCAVRISEFESVETALTLAGRVDWVWVDCFTRFPLTRREALRLECAGFKLCLVSPELQGRGADAEIPAMAERLSELRIRPEAVCTKRPDLWKSSGCIS